MKGVSNPSSNLPSLLERFFTICQDDPRILAATLGGSHARGAADEWSDVDIGVVVTDDAYDEFVATRRAFLQSLGEPLFIEDFDLEGIVFFILTDGTEGELTYARRSDYKEPSGSWRVVVDKTGVLAQAEPRPRPDPAAQREALRRQLTWFWHDLSHFITAIARGQLWWAAGQLDLLRRVCLNLARLHHNFDDEEVGDDPAFKIDQKLPTAALVSLRGTFVPLERAALLAAGRVIAAYYRELAIPLAEEHGVPYPADLERVMLSRFSQAYPEFPDFRH